jgi:hypothetical protein
MTTTNSTTQAILHYLNYTGYVAWRNNNGAIYDVKRQAYRKNPTTKHGVPDIIGFRKADGVALFVEVKTGRDKLSQAQQVFIEQAKDAGCIALVVKSYDELISKISYL